MDGKLKQPQYLWDLIIMQSLDGIEVFLDGLSFEYKQYLDNGLLYSSFGEALIVELQNAKPRMITYKTNNEADYTNVLTYAKQRLQYKIINDNRNGNEHVVRLDGEALTLFCRSVTQTDSVSHSLRLLFNTSLLTDVVNVTISSL